MKKSIKTIGIIIGIALFTLLAYFAYIKKGEAAIIITIVCLLFLGFFTWYTIDEHLVYKRIYETGQPVKGIFLSHKTPFFFGGEFNLFLFSKTFVELKQNDKMKKQQLFGYFWESPGTPGQEITLLHLDEEPDKYIPSDAQSKKSFFIISSVFSCISNIFLLTAIILYVFT